ncbi:fumarate hydratase [Tepiditoga spiralis]|uniref:Fumarate hydratase n=1 Tax=Tepiditoga spiralis TaxID=2108365 RepID=A0A7G1G5Y6_9BACT|nr:fumarate hydratase [Tepiditoga spiralis]BBE30203.1 fumarate hydratase [Tepiditoga spiralis]
MESVDLNSIKNELIEAIKNANVLINSKVKEKVDNYSGLFCNTLKENYSVSKDTGMPLCQDTGMVEFFVFVGKDLCFNENINDFLNNCVEEVYTKNPFRYSTVNDPLFERKNLNNNTPAIVHLFQTNDSTLKIKFLIKGGGSENNTALFMLKPSSTKEDVVEIVKSFIKENGAKSCPPLHVGIGVGGSSDKAIILSKMALLKDFNERNSNELYANLENKLIKELNELKIGFQGLGKGSSVHSVHINYFPTHIATLPLAISVDCYLCRKGEVCFEY